jgi:hypothetical protein
MLFWNGPTGKVCLEAAAAGSLSGTNAKISTFNGFIVVAACKELFLLSRKVRNLK